MKFEQPGVRNIRERKAAIEARRYREQNGDKDAEPRKGTIEHLIWTARQKMTPEQRAEQQRKMQARLEEMDREAIRRHRCSDCGADTINYSHSFSCRWRGSGF